LIIIKIIVANGMEEEYGQVASCGPFEGDGDPWGLFPWPHYSGNEGALLFTGHFIPGEGAPG
jgi:hypothetical protein